MKKICMLLAILLMIAYVPAPAYAADAVITQTYSCTYETEQGKNNFRFVQFDGDKITDMVYSLANSRWEANPVGVIKTNALTPGPTTDVGYLFTAPQKGVVRLQGTIGWALSKNDGGDGVLATIGKGDETLWTQDIPFGETPSYDIEVNIRKGDEIWFRVNAKKSNGYDVISWWPSVSYTAKAYSGAAGKEGYQYMQRMDGELSELMYDEDSDRFLASDGIAFMNDYEMMPSDKCSMVTRYKVSKNGKYQVAASITGTDRRGSGSIVYVLHNDKLMWQQMIPGGEKGVVDVRFTAKEEDIIDIEVKTNDYSGYNYSEWSADVKYFDGSKPFSSAKGSTELNCSVDDEFTLSSKIGSSAKPDVSLYALYNDTKFPMSFASGAWSTDVLGDATCKITSTAVTPANQRGEPAIDLVLSESGIIKIGGNLPVNKGTSGMLIKVCLNDREIWSNRVGGDVSVKYDEEIDTVYFVDDIDVTQEVKAGDKLTFKFGKWRRWTNGTSLNIEDIKIRYVSGDVLSQTTRWKINRSTVIDTAANRAYVNGKPESAPLVIQNGTTYVTEAFAKELGFEVKQENTVELGGEQYVSIRNLAEASGKTVVWGADRFVVIHDGISTFFGVPEFSEMLVAANGGGLID